MLFCINGIIQQSKNQTLYSCISIGSKPVENKKKICSNKFQKEILTIKEILSPESKNLSSVNYLDEFLAKFNGDQSQLMVGNIIHATNDANSLKSVLKLTKQIKCSIFTFEIARPITWGSKLEMYIHFDTIECTVLSIKEQPPTQKSDFGDNSNKKIRVLKKYSPAYVELLLDTSTSVCVHGSSDRILSNFLLRNSGQSVAAGKILGIVE